MSTHTVESVMATYGVTDERYAEEIADAMNCETPNTFGHSQCGPCDEHKVPMKMCGCRYDELGTGKRIPLPPEARDATR